MMDFPDFIVSLELEKFMLWGFLGFIDLDIVKITDLVGFMDGVI